MLRRRFSQSQEVIGESEVEIEICRGAQSGLVFLSADRTKSRFR